MARGIRALAVAVFAAASVTAPNAEAATGIQWRDCEQGLQCATFDVPADWRKPGGPKVPLDLVRARAKDPGRRVGSLLANFGSGNTTSFPLSGMPPVKSMLDQLTERLDVVMFDPRGLGRPPGNAFVKCDAVPPPVNGLVRAENEAQWNAHAEANAKYDASCRKAAGPAFEGLTSWQVAHDIDALRAALGDEKLRYFGNSYGTAYGQAYIDLFPQRVDRMYLDGVADHTQPQLETWLRNYAVAQEKHWDHLDSWCAERAGCMVKGAKPSQVWDELIARAPLPAPGAGPGLTVTVKDLYAGALIGLAPPVWPRLTRALAEARAGDAGRFLTDLKNAPIEGFGSVQAEILCHDFLPKVPSYQEFLGIEKRLQAVAPRFGWIEGRFEVGRCLGIPGQPSYPPKPLRPVKLAPVLVGIGELDNNTNNIGAAAVAAQLPGSRTLWHGDGHAAYLHGNTCLRTHVNRYLTEGALPPVGQRCAGELIKQIPDRPAG
ncbi:alpha/beta fold hydrolase [Allokutzneria sp. NRRL B-24872]|uniref:alpha/beta fold hydrolase n=1 Tax=Allokutzneria sp. NRRL B-24872 TaxID=1137961 RepID=UPI00143CE40B|nr:alpha/beta fold hydrolase [Allokutzneria sp. NRRL B-24872]